MQNGIEKMRSVVCNLHINKVVKLKTHTKRKKRKRKDEKNPGGPTSIQQEISQNKPQHMGDTKLPKELNKFSKQKIVETRTLRLKGSSK